jgi:hypothetical protein
MAVWYPIPAIDTSVTYEQVLSANARDTSEASAPAGSRVEPLVALRVRQFERPQRNLRRGCCARAPGRVRCHPPTD